jgi:dienelactone hydrolase
MTLQSLRSRSRSDAAVARFAATCLAATIVFAALLFAHPAAARARAPEDFGRHAVHVTRVRIAVPPDPNGPEGVLPWVAADVYVPSGRGPWPLVQISHAYPGTLREFPLSGWGKRLASRGFVVIVSDRRAGSSLALTPALDQPADLIDLSADVNSEDILRVVRWAIRQNAVPGSPLHGKVDARRIALAGHSLGGYLATFAAVRAQSEGPRLSALVLLDPSDERLGTLTKDSSLPQTRSLNIPTMVLASEENQHPVMCNMTQGTDCTLVAPQQYRALPTRIPRLGLRVVGSVHEDVEDPSTIGTPASRRHLRTFERYGMAWLEFWLGRDCDVAGYLGGPRAIADQKAGRIALLPGASRAPACPS